MCQFFLMDGYYGPEYNFIVVDRNVNDLLAYPVDCSNLNKNMFILWLANIKKTYKNIKI